LILAALSENLRELKGALWSEDTEAMRDCLERLGIRMRLDVDPDEPANRSIRFLSTGLNSIANGGTPERPLELMVQNAGNAARFLTALVCLGQGCYRISGTPRMHERPQAGLFAALRQLGYRIDSPNDKLPAIIYGSGPHAGAKCSVRIQESSQFASALLLAAPYGGWEVSVEEADTEDSSYVELTAALIEQVRQDGYRSLRPTHRVRVTSGAPAGCCRIRKSASRTGCRIRCKSMRAFPTSLGNSRTPSHDAVIWATAL
jgi:3-phosphoshikimate 1-carboxyvinyltransferase